MNKKRKSIVFLIPSLSVGGAEHQTIQQVNAFNEKGYKVFLCILNASAPLLDKIQLPRNQVYFLGAKGSTLTMTSLISSLTKINKLVRICKKEQITHMIANLPLGHWYGRLVKLFYPSLRLLNYHRSLQYDANPLDTVSKRLFNSSQLALANKTDDVSICISQAVKDNISTKFPLKNPVIVYNSVPDKYVAVADSLQSKTNHQQIKIVLPGRVHPSKGHLFFLKVCKRLIDLFPQKLSIKFAGGGPLEQQVRDYIEEHRMQDVVTVSGYLPNEILLKEIYHADLVLIPSLHEGLGNVAIEALMLGKTVIASDAGGLKEIIKNGENGYLFKTGNEADCFSVCKSVLDKFPASKFNPDSQRLDFHQRFSFEAHLKQLEHLIR